MKWFSSFLVVLGVSGWAHCLTLSDLLTQTRLYLNDTASNSELREFSDSQLTDLFNLGQKEVNARVWAVVLSTEITLVNGTTEYSLPSDYVMALRVTVNHTPIPERTFSFLDDSKDSWIQDSGGVPLEYYIRVDSSVVDGVTKESIGLHPVSTGTWPMGLTYLGQPSNLSASSDVPFGSANNRFYPFHHVLSFYGAFYGWLIRGDSEKALFYKNSFDTLVGYMESINRVRFSYNPQFRGVGLVTEQKTGGAQ